VGCSLQGALAHAKNGDEVFWKEKFHAANGKAQTCTQGTLFFFLLWFGVLGGEERFFFIFPNFPMCSHYVPFKFPMGSQYFPNIFFIPPHFYMPWKMVSSFHLYGWPKGRNCTAQNRVFCFGESPLFLFFWSDGPIKLTHCPQKKT